MSKWYEIKDIEDLDIDGDDLNICFDDDYSGNIYVSVPIAMLKKVLTVRKTPKTK